MISKRITGFLILVICIICVPCLAFAGVYADADISIDIPEGDNVYYYTQNDTNMQNDMLERAREEENLLLLVGSYNEDGYLAYSLKIQAEPITDEQMLDNRLEQTMQSTDYEFEPVTQEQPCGQTVQVAKGKSTKDNNYHTKIYLYSYNDKLYQVNILYKEAQDDVYLQRAMTQMDSLILGKVEDIQQNSPEPEPSLTIEPSPEPTALQTPSPLEIQQSMVEIQDTSKQGFYMVLCLAIAVLLLAVLLIILIVNLKKKKRKQQNGYAKQYQPVYSEMRSNYEMRPQYEIATQYEMQPHYNENVSVFSADVPASNAEIYAPMVKKAPRFEEIPQLKQQRFNLVKSMGAAQELRAQKQYIYAAKIFHDCVKHATDREIQKFADMQTIECLIKAKEYRAALKMTMKAFYKDYDFTLDERMKLQSIINLLRDK